MNSSMVGLLAVAPATIYSILSLWCGRQFFGQHQQKPAPDQHQPISILKPIKGMDQGSYENFASFCQQDYSAAVQIIFCVADQSDPAIVVIQRLMANFPDHDISLSIDPTIHGPNYKVSNLINGFQMAKHDLLMICDSDIRVESDFLQSVSSHFKQANVGLVTSPYRSSQINGVSTALEALAFTTELIPNVVTAIKLEGLSFALGAAMTFRRSALADIGGLESLVEYLADDYQLGNQIHKAGWLLKLDQQFVESMLKPESVAGILTRQLRWARTMKVSRPGGYLASGITLPGLAILLALLTAPLKQALAAILLLYIVRIAVCTCFSRCYTKDQLLPRWSWLLPLRDLLAFATWLLAFAGNRVNWRGHDFVVRPGGKLEEL